MWILFIWVLNTSPVLGSPGDFTVATTSITSQVFDSKLACLNAGIKLHEQIGEDIRFLCMDKKDTLKISTPKKRGK